MNPVSNKQTITFLAALFLFVVPVEAQDKPDKKLEQAIAVLRRVDHEKLSEEQQKTKAKEIDAAWGVIKAEGKTGVARLKEEIQLIDRNKEKDDYFKLNASALLWIIGQFDEVDAIAAIWRSTPLNAQYKYVFHTAYAAAQTQDRRALPLLLACLKDNHGRVDLLPHTHTMTTWLGALGIIWGAFGPQGAPDLLRVLETSNNAAELEAVIYLLIWTHEIKDNTFLFSVNKYRSVEERHILSAATASDIPLLLEVKAALCARLSEESLVEIKRLNEVIERLVRSRYRKVIGLTEKVE